MRNALLFAMGALGLLALANYLQTAGQRTAEEATPERQRRPRARRMRLRHRTADGLLDLNSASLAEVMELTGMDGEMADRILENRPYFTKIDLVGRRIVPDGVYESIKHSITVTHAA
jgi:competence protein ComEA